VINSFSGLPSYGEKSGLLAILFFCITSSINAQSSLRIWYDAPATMWEACVPIGNGRLGAMPDGGVLKENIVLNDITLWSGAAQDADQAEAYKYLPEIQQLLREGKNIDAEAVMAKHFICQGPGSGTGAGAKVPYGSYEILSNLALNFNYGKDSSGLQRSKYMRSLSLDSAIAKTSLVIDGIKYEREYLSSFDKDIIAIRVSASAPGSISFSAGLTRPEKYHTKTDGPELIMEGQLRNGVDAHGMKYMVRLQVKNEGGYVTYGDSLLTVSNANSAIIYISAATDFRDSGYVSASEKALRQAMDQSYASLKKVHIQKFQSLFNRASLQLDGDYRDSIPTDVRLQRFGETGKDNALCALYFQFGRYLLICSTRPGLLPPNLQGLWANTIQTPWNGDYHLNINIQMNHWPLDVGNLGMLNEPFFSIVKTLVAPGEKTAKSYYNAPGWVAHTITNVWGYTSPGEHYSWGSFNTGSAWLCAMLWRHYEFSRDKEYLEKLYPVIKKSAEFYLSFLVEDPKYGWLVTSPSNSPENAFILPDGREAHVCESPTIDNQILRALFQSVIDACNILKVDDSLRSGLQSALKRLPPTRIGSDGRIMEWLEEYKEAEPHHRHTSHLWGLHPGNEITEQTPALANAAKATLEARGDDGTGWSLAWKINFWSRLHDGDRSYKLLKRLLKPVFGTGFDMNSGGTYPNLFCGHTPYQIDGNFGGTAGIAEMLLQSHAGYIELLPALPKEWADGSFEGLCVRGGGVLSAKWKNYEVESIRLTATAANTFRIALPGTRPWHVWKNGVKINPMLHDRMLEFKLQKSDILSISP
ncbi:MAG: glycoside hydrolase N-terminal domain-containing protein, partial [Ginsengibacter sp.]